MSRELGMLLIGFIVGIGVYSIVKSLEIEIKEHRERQTKLIAYEQDKEFHKWNVEPELKELERTYRSLVMDFRKTEMKICESNERIRNIEKHIIDKDKEDAPIQ